jgi:hypothetical protein
MRFVIGKLADAELHSLREGGLIISKLLLVPDDYKLFRYRSGDDIEAETEDGNRIWTTIKDIEVVEDKERVIVILTLSSKAASPGG